MAQSLSALGALITTSVDLEDRASKVQSGHQIVASKSKLQALEADYHRWMAQALHRIPEELRSAFEEQYEGHFLSHRIKHFLESPGERNGFHDPASPLGGEYFLHDFASTFRKPIIAQRRILQRAQVAAEGDGGVIAVFDELEALARRLPQFFSALKRRHGGRPGFEVQDEYDVQDAMSAILRLHFNDVREEDAVPSRAGKNSRVDHLLKGERVVVEIKKTREGLTDKVVGGQLIEDIERYREHPDCDGVMAIVYDPERLLTNPRGLEDDLNRGRDGLAVRVVVSS